MYHKISDNKEWVNEKLNQIVKSTDINIIN